MMEGHRYLIRFSNTKRLVPKQIDEVRSQFAKRARQFGAAAKNLRISEIALEFDLFANEMAKKLVVHELGLEYGHVLTERDLTEENTAPPINQDKQTAMKLAVNLFNEQRYWECHEATEAIWRMEKDPIEKDVQHGLILGASALVHAQKNENQVCLRMLPRTLEMLRGWEKKDYYGLKVDLLRNYLQDILATGRIEFHAI